MISRRTLFGLIPAAAFAAVVKPDEDAGMARLTREIEANCIEPWKIRRLDIVHEEDFAEYEGYSA